jgi:hypothetical protein
MICLSPDSISFVHFIAGFGKAATGPTRKFPAKHFSQTIKIKEKAKAKHLKRFCDAFSFAF